MWGSLMNGLGSIGSGISSGFDTIGGGRGMGSLMQGIGGIGNVMNNKTMNKEMGKFNDYNISADKKRQAQYDEDRDNQQKLRF